MLSPVFDAQGDTLSDWLSDRDIVQIDQLSRAPWSRVFRLTAADGARSVLKVVGRPRAESFVIAQALSDQFAQSVPHLLGSDQTRGVLWFEDLAQDEPDQKQELTRFAVLGSYGMLQSRVAAQPEMLTDHGIKRSYARETAKLFWALAEGEAAPGNVLSAASASLMSRLQDHALHLEQLAEQVDSATPTLNHTDLNTGNVMVRRSGQICLIDWDDAIYSAPGWSLHMPFSGLTALYRAAVISDSFGKQDLFSMGFRLYARALCKYGSYTKSELKTLLPASGCFGVLKYVTDLAPYDIGRGGLFNEVSRFANRRLHDLCNTLDAMFPAAQRIAPGARLFTDAPLVPFPAPSHLGTLEQQVDDAAKLFRENGTVALRGCVEPAHLTQVNTEIEHSWQRYEDEIASGGALRVGSGRYMISLSTDGAVGTPEVLAAPKIVGLCRKILGQSAILGSLTTVVSLPGSPAQRWHCDNDSLFPEEPEMETPVFSVAVILPTIQLLPEIGATEIQPGSHRVSPSRAEAAYSAIPDLELGDCYVMDSRVMHRGLPNQSQIKRPILSLVYQRPWYQDFQNFSNQETLSLSQARLEAFEKADQPLVSWAVRRSPS